MKNYLIGLISLAIVVSEVLLMVNKVAGFLMYSVLFLGSLIIFSKQEKLDNFGKLAVFLLVLPVLRIAQLFVVFDSFWTTAIVYYLMFFLAAFYSFKFKEDPGYSVNGLWLLVLVVPLSLGIGFVGSVFLDIEPSLGILVMLPLVVFAEELLFRGLIQRTAEHEFGSVIAVIGTSLLYALFGLSFGTSAFVFFLVFSVVAGAVYSFSENLYLTLVLNFIVSLMVFVVPKFS